MTAKEKLLERAPNWSEEQAERALLAGEEDPKVEARRTVDDWDKQWGAPEMAPLPEHLKTFEDGTPVPNWVATLDEVRRGR
jgi:hypothetical protein